MPPLPPRTFVPGSRQSYAWGGSQPRYLELIDGEGPVAVVPYGPLRPNACPRHEGEEVGRCCAAHGDGPAYPCCICGQAWMRAARKGAK